MEHPNPTHTHPPKPRPVANTVKGLVHLPDELVDVGFPVTKVTALDVVLEFTYPPATGRVGEFERPQEVRCLFEVGASGCNLVNEVLDGEDIVFAKGLLDDRIVGKGDTLLVDLAVAPLVDQLTHRLQVRFAICDVRLNETEHLLRCPCNLDKNAIVDLEQAEQLQYFAGFRGNLVDTADTNDKVDLRLCRYVEVAC